MCGWARASLAPSFPSRGSHPGLRPPQRPNKHPTMGAQKSWLLPVGGPGSGVEPLSAQYSRLYPRPSSDNQIPPISLNDSSQMVHYSFSQGYAICCPNYWIMSVLTKRN